MSMRRAIGIIRVSQVGRRQGESFASPAEQRGRIEQACERLGLQLVDVHEELDVSGGATLTKRPGLSKAVAAIEAGRAEVVAAAYFDRLFRSLTTQAEVMERVERAGGQILAVDVGQVTNSSAGQWLSGTVLGAMSEYVRRTARDRGNETADRIIARGVANRVPFGYMRNGRPDGAKIDRELDVKALVPDLKTAPFVTGIFEKRASGHAWAQIARWLADEGVRPARGGGWTTSTLRNIVRNEVYLGHVVLGKRRVEDVHAPLVSRALWSAAQSSRTVQRTGRNAAGIAGGLLRCESCEGWLSVTGTNPAYTCRRTINGKPCERPVYVSKVRADEFVDRIVMDVLAHGRHQRVVSDREVDKLRQAWEEAAANLRGYIVGAESLDPQHFKMGLEPRQRAVADAKRKYDEAREQLTAGEGLLDPGSYQALVDAGDVDGRRPTARALIREVIVAAPESRRDRGPGTDVAKRFTVVAT